MRLVGIINNVLPTGHITIPSELREVWGIEEGTPLRFYIGEDGELSMEILRKKYMPMADYVRMLEKMNRFMYGVLKDLPEAEDKEKLINFAKLVVEGVYKWDGEYYQLIDDVET